MTRVREEGGFTLVEMMVALQLMLIVMFASLMALEQFTTMGKRSQQRIDLQEQARQAARTMSRSLRNVASSADAADAIERADPYDLVFKQVDDSGAAAGSNDRRLERVRYCLDSSDADRGRIREQVQSWTTAAVPAIPAGTACPATAWGTSRVVADSISNRVGGADRPVWTYRRTAGRVSSVSISIWLDDDIAQEPRETTLTTGVFLRNQNRPPVVSFTATPAGSRHLLLNGSASYDPEGQPLELTWRDGTVQVGQGVNLDYAAGTAGLHTITLEVADPAGLTASTQQTVVVP